jgi:uncharacterized membrane protein YhaH (DUF805 family)
MMIHNENGCVQTLALQVNNSPWLGGGRIGRLMFIRNLIINSVVAVAAMLVPAYVLGYCNALVGFPVDPETLKDIIVVYVFLVGLYSWVLAIKNGYKRLRDITGKSEVSVWYLAALFVPIVSIVLCLYILLAPGKRPKNEQL